MSAERLEYLTCQQHLCETHQRYTCLCECRSCTRMVEQAEAEMNRLINGEVE